MNVFNKDNKQEKMNTVLHAYVERDSIQCALVQYGAEHAHVLASFNIEDKQIITPANGLGLEKALEKTLLHFSVSDASDDNKESHLEIDSVVVTMSPLFLDIESAQVLRIHEKPELIRTFETDLDISDEIVHREIRDVSLNGYTIAAQHAIGLQAETVSFTEEMHTLDYRVAELVRKIFSKQLPERRVVFTSALAESTYLIERILSPHGDWQMINMDHDDSLMYDRATANLESLQYGSDELMRQCIAQDISYDDPGVLTAMRMADRNDLVRKELEKLTYVLDIEGSVLGDAVLSLRDIEKTLYFQSPHSIVGTLVSTRLGGIPLHRAYSDSSHFGEVVAVPPHLSISIHMYAAIEHHLVRPDAVL